MPDKQTNTDSKNSTDKDVQPEDNKTHKKRKKKNEAGEITKVNDKIEKFGVDEIDKTFIKKRGFLIALEGNGESKELFEKELVKINNQYDNLIKNYKESLSKRIEGLRETDKRNMSSLVLLETKKKEYENKIKEENPKTRIEIEKQVEVVNKEVYAILKDIGKAKENIVETSLRNYKTSMELGIKINRDLQNEQNEALDKEYQKYKNSDERKIEFWNKILENYQQHYSRVTERIKFLAKDGINNQTSSFLIFLGTVAALVSGYWFSLWTGGLTKTAENLNVENTSVRFFFLDNIAKFFSHHTVSELVSWLAAYLIAVGFVSWLCYYLLVKFGFILKPKSSKKSKSPNDHDDTEDFEVKLQENDDILKTTFKGNSWWVIWLKIAPVILAIVPVLAILSIESKTEQGTFQNLFDSLVNQFIGTCIAISFSTFTILYFSRITENNYHNDGSKEQKKNGIVFYFGFVIFTLMISGMILYQYHVLFFNDIRRIAILGFFVSCIATGFSLGYGYLFRNLSINSEFLLERISIISDIIYRYSKPYMVNYTSNGILRQKIYELQYKNLNMIEYRQELTSAIAGGYDIKYDWKSNDHRTKSEQTKETNEKDNEKEKSRPNVFDQIFSFLKLRWLIQKEQNEKEETRFNIVHNISDTEKKYFSEKSEQLGELNQKIKELKLKLEQLNKNEEDYLRNEGLYRSLNDQIHNMELANQKIVDEIVRVEKEILIHSNNLEEVKEKAKVFLHEGYQTGMWFKVMNDDSSVAIVHS